MILISIKFGFSLMGWVLSRRPSSCDWAKIKNDMKYSLNSRFIEPIVCSRLDDCCDANGFVYDDLLKG